MEKSEQVTKPMTSAEKSFYNAEIAWALRAGESQEVAEQMAKEAVEKLRGVLKRSPRH